VPGRAVKRISRIAIIGLGAIGRTVVDRLLEGGVTGSPPDCIALIRPQHHDALAAAYGDRMRLTTTIDEIIESEPDIVIETAGQSAVRDHAETILAAVLDLMLVSTGALVDDVLRARLQAVGEASGARLLIPAGAIAGLDGLGALKLSGGLRVRYISTKPPAAWRGTPAEQMVELDAITTPTTFFRGPASQAASLFPRNANLAATIALAGAGLERTQVDLVADPNASGNCGRFEAEGNAGKLDVTVAGPSMAGNAKTSAITAYSVLSALAMTGQTIALLGG
jgi:aspartate dehydrogenase